MYIVLLHFRHLNEHIKSMYLRVPRMQKHKK